MAALLCFFFVPLTLAAIILPLFIHELAHIIVLRFLGLRIRCFSADLRGFCIQYSGYSGAVGHAAAAAAGPAAGFAYAFAASMLSKKIGGSWLCLSAGVSLLMSLFNLLPALPLDGGRILENLSCTFFGERTGRYITKVSGLAVSTALLIAGMWIMFAGGGAAAELAAVWLLLSQNREYAIVKRREIL